MNTFGLDMPPAVLSEDGLYRYFLSRQWGKNGKKIAFIGLNPSTADALKDDPTIRRCVAFAKAWGGTSLWMINLFAFRATKPSDIYLVDDPVGPENDAWIEKVCVSADLIVAAWGNHGKLYNRAEIIENRFPNKLHALSITKNGMPKHPLYLRKDTLPFRLTSNR